MEWTKEAREARVAQGLRSLGRGRRTDSDAVAADPESLVKGAREALAVSARRGGRGAPAARESEEVIHALHDDLKSSAEGRRLGKLFGHDAFAMARGLGISVQLVPLGKLQSGNRSLITIDGRFLRIPGELPVVQLADTLDPWESSKVLAHEIGHFLDFPSERLCDQFAANFLRVDDSELPGAAWRSIQAELHQREVSRQKARLAAYGA